MFGSLAQKHGGDGTETGAQLMLDLMNEPHSMPTEQVLQNLNAAIGAVRKRGLKNLVLLEGNGWTGMHSWTQAQGPRNPSNAQVFTRQSILDTADHYAINVRFYEALFGLKLDSNYRPARSPCAAYLASRRRNSCPPAASTWRATFFITLGSAWVPNSSIAHHTPPSIVAPSTAAVITVSSSRKWVKPCSTTPGRARHAAVTGAARITVALRQPARRHSLEGNSIIPPNSPFSGRRRNRTLPSPRTAQNATPLRSGRSAFGARCGNSAATPAANATQPCCHGQRPQAG